MVFSQQQVRKVANSDSVKESLARGSQHLYSIKASAQPNDATVELGLQQRLAEVLVDMEQDNLAIATSDADFVVGHCLDASNALGTDRLAKNEHSVFDLIGAEVTRGGPHEHEFFVGLGEGDALVVSDHGSGLHDLVSALAGQRVEGPKSQFFGAGDGKLIIGSVAQFDVFNEATETDSSDSVWENLGSHFERRDNVTILSVPDEQFSVQGITGRNQEQVIVTEGKVGNLVVMLRQSEDGSLRIVVPNDDIRVVASLAC